MDVIGRLNAIADSLNNTPRLGAAVAEPEGMRLVQLSDTYANQIAVFLKGLADILSDPRAASALVALNGEPLIPRPYETATQYSERTKGALSA